MIEQEIRAERVRQDAKWGEQNHHPFLWITILSEEVGEAAKAALHVWDEKKDAATIRAYREELIQVAAVAVAAIESLDRDRWKP